MESHSRFITVRSLLFASMLLVFSAAAISPCRASVPQAASDAERYVLEQLQKGEPADLEDKFPEDEFPESKRKLSSSFIEELLTDRSLHIRPFGIWIENATITGELYLAGQEIPHDVYLGQCTFENFVNLFDDHFARSLNFRNDEFKEGGTFYGTTVGSDFLATSCIFYKRAEFSWMRVGRLFYIPKSTFKSVSVDFQHLRVDGPFDATESKFDSKVHFNDMIVDGRFSADLSSFRGDEVSFNGAHLADVYLNRITFDGVSTIDFTRLQADSISFDEIEFKTPSEIKLHQVTFKVLSPMNVGKLRFLLSRYDADFFTALETSFRTHGYPDEADKIFLVKRRAERRENCKSFLHQCNRGAWAFSLFEDLLAGYGKSLQNLLYWSLGFLVIGTFVFRSEKGMRTKDWNKAPQYAGKYNPFWYSLDLFLPIIKLGEADLWTPKDNRRWANLYRKVHIIIGSLFVPIGLAAWTGIIK
jgi:hypothetical protein